VVLKEHYNVNKVSQKKHQGVLILTLKVITR